MYYKKYINIKNHGMFFDRFFYFILKNYNNKHLMKIEQQRLFLY